MTCKTVFVNTFWGAYTFVIEQRPQRPGVALAVPGSQLQGVFYLLQIAVYPPLDHHGSDVSHAQINIAPKP